MPGNATPPRRRRCNDQRRRKVETTQSLLARFAGWLSRWRQHSRRDERQSGRPRRRAALSYVTHAQAERKGVPLCRPNGDPLPHKLWPGLPHLIARPDQPVTCNRCQRALVAAEKAKRA